MDSIANYNQQKTELDQSVLPLNDNAWMFRHFIVRSAGMPISLLYDLALPRFVINAIETVQDARAALTHNRDRLLAALPPKSKDRSIRRIVSRVRVDLRAERPVDSGAFADNQMNQVDDLRTLALTYNEAVAYLTDSEIAAATVFDQGLLKTRSALAACTRQTAFQEALHLSNASLAENGSLHLATPLSASNSQRRRREVTATLYLQRLSSKNETNAGFGPINLGQVVQNTTVPAKGLTLENRSASVRKGYVAHWLVQELASAIAADPKLGPFVPLSGAGLRRNDAFRALEGRSPAEIDALGVTPDMLDKAICSGRLVKGFRVPTDAVDQLNWLKKTLMRLAPKGEAAKAAKTMWIKRLDGFDADRNAFCAKGKTAKAAALSQAEKRYAAFSENPARRNAGRMFRTRTLLYEECHAGGVVDLPYSKVNDMADDLEAVIFACRAGAALRQNAEMQSAISVYDKVFGPTKRVRFDRFINAHRAGSSTPLPNAKERGFATAWTQAVIQATRTGSWNMVALKAALDPLELPEIFDLSPDLLFSEPENPDSPLHVTLGEIHHGVTMDGWMLDPVPDGQAISNEIARAKAIQTAQASGLRMANLVLARHMKAAPQVYDGLVVELSGHTTKVKSKALALADLVVERREDGLVLRVAGDPDPRPVMFHAPAFGYTPEAYRSFALFSAPILALPDLDPSSDALDTADRELGISLSLVRPRLGRSHFTIYRRRWALCSKSLVALKASGDMVHRYLEFRRMLKTANIPRFGFMRSSGEPKPVFLDLDSPLLVEAALSTVGDGDRVTLDEMLPGPEDLWLAEPGGEVRTSEFRFLIMGGLHGA